MLWLRLVILPSIVIIFIIYINSEFHSEGEQNAIKKEAATDLLGHSHIWEFND